MNSSTHWNWLKDLETLQQNLDCLLSHSPTHRPERQQQFTTLAEWSPVMHIAEVDREYRIKAELPEVKEADLKVLAEAGSVTITGQRTFETEGNAGKLRGVEPVCESFSRTFSLPDGVSIGNVSAEFKDGMLVVHLIKDEKSAPRQAEIEDSRSA